MSLKLYEELVWRNLIKDVSNVDLAKKQLNENKIKFYCGFDPTFKSLTVGHLVQVVRAILLKNYGHTPVILIGGATGLIGDPRETSERKLLSLEQSLENANAIEQQLKKLVGNDAIYVNNYNWISKIDVISFLRDYGKHFNVSYMLAKDTVGRRLETGISYTEFSYMIIQSIDWLHLYQNHDVKVQFGGSDQWGNITAGLELMRKMIGENDAVGLSSPLLLKQDGTKFGKSEDGALYLDKELTSPYEVYQYFLNTSDDDLLNYFKNLTLFSKDEIENIIDKHLEKPEARYGQKRLSESIVTLLHGEESTKEAILMSEALFSGNFNELSKDAFASLVKTVNSTIKTGEVSLVEILGELELASSRRAAREFIQNGAILINGNRIDDINFVLDNKDAYYNKYTIIRRGRRNYAIIEWE